MIEQFKSIRIGEIEARWTQTSPEIVFWYPNRYYGKLDEYLSNGYEKRGGVIYKDNYGIGLSCFENPETCYTIAFLELVEKEDTCDLHSVGARILDLEREELSDFWEVYRKAHYQIENLMRELEK